MTEIDITPVDYYADALILPGTPSIDREIYHVSASEESFVTFKSIDSEIAKVTGRKPLGKEYEQVDFQRMYTIRKSFSSVFVPCNPRIILQAINFYGQFSQLNVMFDNRKSDTLDSPLPRSLLTMSKFALKQQKGCEFQT